MDGTDNVAAVELFGGAFENFRRAIDNIPVAERKSLSWRSLEEQLARVRIALSQVHKVEAEAEKRRASVRQLLQITQAKIEIEEKAVPEIEASIASRLRGLKALRSRIEVSGGDRTEHGDSPLPQDAPVQPTPLAADVQDDAGGQALQGIRAMLTELVDEFDAVDADLSALEARNVELKSTETGLRMRIENAQSDAEGITEILEKERQAAEESRTRELRWKQEVAQRLGWLGEQVKSHKSKLRSPTDKKTTGEQSAKELRDSQAVIAMRDALSRRMQYGESAKTALEHKERQFQRLRSQVADLTGTMEHTLKAALTESARAQSLQDAVDECCQTLSSRVAFKCSAEEYLADLYAQQQRMKSDKAQSAATIEFLKQIASHQLEDAESRQQHLRDRFDARRQLNSSNLAELEHMKGLS